MLILFQKLSYLFVQMIGSTHIFSLTTMAKSVFQSRMTCLFIILIYIYPYPVGSLNRNREWSILKYMRMFLLLFYYITTTQRSSTLQTHNIVSIYIDKILRQTNSIRDDKQGGQVLLEKMQSTRKRSMVDIKWPNIK